MALISWKPNYSVGVKTLDEQHLALIGILNEFHAAMLNGKGPSIAGTTLSRLATLAREHVDAEETLMAAVKFDGLAAHRIQHAELLGKLDEFARRYKSGDSSIYIDLLRFLREWLDRHMLQSDRQYASWLSQHKAS